MEYQDRYNSSFWPFFHEMAQIFRKITSLITPICKLASSAILALKDCLTAGELKLKKQLVRHLYHDMLMFHHREFENLPRRI